MAKTRDDSCILHRRAAAIGISESGGSVILAEPGTWAGPCQLLYSRVPQATAQAGGKPERMTGIVVVDPACPVAAGDTFGVASDPGGLWEVTGVMRRKTGANVLVNVTRREDEPD